jgi:hypothetical protein
MEPTMEAGVEAENGTKGNLGPVVQIDEGRIQVHLDEVVRSTVEETLNALLDAEADHLCGARKYERTEGRKDTRAGRYDRRLQTKAGEVTLTVPKLRNLPFECQGFSRGTKPQQNSRCDSLGWWRESWGKMPLDRPHGVSLLQ